jgi:hypothetical protein
MARNLFVLPAVVAAALLSGCAETPIARAYGNLYSGEVFGDEGPDSVVKKHVAVIVADDERFAGDYVRSGRAIVYAGESSGEPRSTATESRWCSSAAPPPCPLRPRAHVVCRLPDTCRTISLG